MDLNDFKYLKKVIAHCAEHGLTCEIRFDPSNSNIMQMRVLRNYNVNKAFVNGVFKIQK